LRHPKPKIKNRKYVLNNNLQKLQWKSVKVRKKHCHTTIFWTMASWTAFNLFKLIEQFNFEKVELARSA